AKLLADSAAPRGNSKIRRLTGHPAEAKDGPPEDSVATNIERLDLTGASALVPNDRERSKSLIRSLNRSHPTLTIHLPLPPSHTKAPTGPDHEALMAWYP